MKKNILPVFLSFCIAAAVGCNSQSKTNQQPAGEGTAENKAGTEEKITEKYWKLIEINGKPVKVDSSFMKEPHVIFKEANNQVNGNGGCNGFGGAYELKSPNRIKVSNLVSTMMACPALDIENQFTKALQEADSYYAKNDTLVLNRARMAPLARLVAVYMK